MVILLLKAVGESRWSQIDFSSSVPHGQNCSRRVTDWRSDNQVSSTDLKWVTDFFSEILQEATPLGECGGLLSLFLLSDGRSEVA